MIKTENTRSFIIDIVEEAQKWGKNGYDNVAQQITKYITPCSHFKQGHIEYLIEDIKITHNATKEIAGSVLLKNDTTHPYELKSTKITDKLTGEVLPLNTNGIDLRDFKPSQLNDLLSGKKIDHFDSAGNFLGKLGLSKTPAGWGLTIGKQTVMAIENENSI